MVFNPAMGATDYTTIILVFDLIGNRSISWQPETEGRPLALGALYPYAAAMGDYNRPA